MNLTVEIFQPNLDTLPVTLSSQVPGRQRGERRPDGVRGVHVRLRGAAVPQGPPMQPRVPRKVRRQVAQGELQN